MQIVNPLTCDDWNRLVLTDPDACIFHSSEWAQTLHESYGFTPQYLAITTTGGALRAALPMMGVMSVFTGKRGVSLPFSDFCPILQRSNDPNATDEIVAKALELGRQQKWKYLELRAGRPAGAAKSPHAHYVTHTVNLKPSENELFAALKGTVRTAVRKAQQSGVQVVTSTTRAAVQAFYRLHCLTRRTHGIPPQPFSFFAAIHRNILEKGFGRVILATQREKTVSAAIFLHFGAHALFKYGASDSRYQSLRGNDLVMWEGMRQYRREGFLSLNMGRTDPANEGLLRFKRGWGTVESPVDYFRMDPQTEQCLTSRHTAEGGHSRLVGVAPIWLLRLTGCVLYRHVA